MDVFWQHSLISIIGSFCIAALCMQMALIPWKKSQGLHWTERARLLWPARRVTLGVTGACFASSVAVNQLLGGSDRWGQLFWGVIVGLVAGSFVSTRQIEPRYTLRVWAGETFWSLLVQFGIVGLFVWMLNTMPENPQGEDFLRVAFGCAAMVVIATGAWLPLVELFRRKPPCAQEERLRRIVAEMTALTGVTPRWVFFGKSPTARAAALVHIRSLVMTSRIMEVLDDDELRTIILHEMSHLREGLAVRLSRLTPLLTLVAIVFVRPVVHHFEFLGLVALFGGAIGVSKLASNIARKMERQADDAASHGAVDPAKYASALEKIYETNQLPAVMRGNSMVHPHLYDRMLAAGVTPAYPRPNPPGLMAWPGWTALFIPALLFACIIFKRVAERRAHRPVPQQMAR